METENQDIQEIAASEFLEWVTIKYQFVPQVLAQLPSVEELERELEKNAWNDKQGDRTTMKA
jgi:hypothetical protein